MSPTLPEKGLWHVADRRGLDEVPFDLIKLDLSGRGFGTVRARNLETRLRRVRVTGPDRFVAGYDIRGHSGEVEGVYRPDGSLRLSLTGTVSASFLADAAANPLTAEVPGPWHVLSGAVSALCGKTPMGGCTA
jgi:hypothetical protein